MLTQADRTATWAGMWNMHRKYNRQKNIIGRNPEVAADHFLSKISVPLAGAITKRVTQNTVKISETKNRCECVGWFHKFTLYLNRILAFHWFCRDELENRNPNGWVKRRVKDNGATNKLLTGRSTSLWCDLYCSFSKFIGGKIFWSEIHQLNCCFSSLNLLYRWNLNSYTVSATSGFWFLPKIRNFYNCGF